MSYGQYYTPQDQTGLQGPMPAPQQMGPPAPANGTMAQQQPAPQDTSAEDRLRAMQMMNQNMQAAQEAPGGALAAAIQNYAVMKDYNKQHGSEGSLFSKIAGMFGGGGA